jgi:O-antigen ligase/tetratricopeptide (TPR) repeat protein
MVILRFASRLGLWALAWLLLAVAWMGTASASAFDARVPFGLLPCAAAWLLGSGVAAVLARALPDRFRHPDATRHGLALLVVAACAQALSHAGPHMSIRVLREELPPLFFPLHVGLSGLAPLLLAAAGNRAPGRLALLLALFLTSLGGSIFMLEPGMAASLALVALLLTLADHGPAARLDRVLLPGALFVALAGLATHFGHNLLAALPSLTWIVAVAALGLACAFDRDREPLARDVLGSLVAAAVLVALCGAALTVWLGLGFDWRSAVATRLVLFRQHPNFLAPYFGMHAVLALGLALRRSRASPGWAAAALLLAGSTVLTDSRTGITAMAAGFLTLPAFWLLAAVMRRVGGRVLLAAALLLALLAGAGWLAAGGGRAAERIASGLDRFEKSMEFRVDAWSNAVDVIRRHPWLGIGPGTFIAVERFRPGSRFANEPEVPHPHNMPLYVAQAAGLPALAVALAWCGWLVLRAWRAFRARDPALPGALPSTLLAATVTALLASLFDLGLALETVVPAPLWIFTGLLAARPPAEAPRPAGTPRPATCLAWAIALALLFVRFGVQPLRAQSLALQAQLLSFTGQQEDDTGQLGLARTTMARALELYPPTPRAHELLSRWLEQAGEVPAARRVLLRRVELAPHDATGHSLLGHLEMRQGAWAPAADALARALEDIHGSQQENRDRADRVLCLLNLGLRDEAQDLLVEALRIDSGVIALLPWQDAATGAFRLRVAGQPPPPPLDLVVAVEILFGRHVIESAAGRDPGRRAWMDCNRAFRVARRDDKATSMLDWMEANLPAGLIEPETIANERGQIALDAGQLDEAQAHFERAFELSGNPHFRVLVAEVRRRRGEAPVAGAEARSAMAESVEILDQPAVFQENLRHQATAALDRGQPLAAADAQLRSLPFEDDLLARVRLRLEAAGLQLRGGRADLALQVLRTACEDLAAKAFPWTALQEDPAETLPGRVATALVAAWRAQGLDAAARRHAAWGLPDFFSSRQGPSLLRLALYDLNAQPDQLLREADLQLLADPHHLPALWARLFALEASGRHLELGAAMRTLAEEFGRTASAERLWKVQVDVVSGNLADPDAWRQLALLTLLRGRYEEALGWFDKERACLANDPAAEARACGWQALAAFLASRPDRARTILREAAELQPEVEMVKLRLGVIPP